MPYSDPEARRIHDRAQYRANPGPRKRTVAKWRKGNPQKVAEYNRRAYDPARYLGERHGLTLAEYNALLEAQGGLCAICRQPETWTRNGVPVRLAVDHNHRTGLRRGLLCRRCNQVLGRMLDDPTLFEAAAEYLRRFG